MTRFRAVLVLQVCATFTIWAQGYDRLQIRFDGKATLSVRGETPSCGFAGCPYGSHYCSSFWNLCEGERSRTVVIPGSYLTLGAEFGGMSYSSGATLDAVLDFSFLYNKPTLNIPGYSYTPKQELGFLYFVDNVYASTLALAVAACNGDCCPDSGSGSASASASSVVRTTIVGASSSSSRSASCSECPDSDGGGSMHSDPPYPESYRGKTVYRLSPTSGAQSVHTEKMTAEHELAHVRHIREGILCNLNRRGAEDRDRDGLRDEDELVFGLHPCNQRLVHPSIPDAEVIAIIEGYGKLLQKKDYWKEDWATCGLQWGAPPSPFPWKYVRGNRVSNTPYYDDLLTELPNFADRRGESGGGNR